MSIINPYTVIAAFALFLIIFAIWKPQVSRIVLGIFFLIMALGVNLSFILTDPTMFVEAGRNALLPIYKWFFTVILAWNPILFAIPLMLIEITIGTLILSKGKYVRYGMIAAAIFCLLLTPVGKEELTSPLIAIAPALMIRKSFDLSLWDLIRGIFKKR